MARRRLQDFAGRWLATTAKRTKDAIRQGRTLSDRKLRELFGE